MGCMIVSGAINFMHESFVAIDNDYMFYRHNEILPGRQTLLFVHGLGESGLCFEEVFNDKRFQDFNILVPDMIGYGRSSKSEAGDYRFKSQITRLSGLLELYEVDKLILIGHSMGGDITTLFCADDHRGLVKQYVNIEGDITQFDIFISYDAVKADKENRFHEWFYDEFINSKVYEYLGNKYPSCRRYYASLYFCHPEAFLSNALELVKRNTSLPGKYKSEIGKMYCDLSVPRVYCYGTKSLPSETLCFLEENDLKFQSFEGASHWLMIDKSDEFYGFLYSFVSSGDG